MENYTYIRAADTAKLIRAQLKKHFPTCKFWVRSQTYAGGASIDIDWVDGATTEQVDKIVKPFSGAGFDGMNDYKTHNKAYLLPDGSAAFAEIERYNDENLKFEAPTGAQLVHFGADFIFTHRHYTPEKSKPVIKRICDEYGKPEPKYYESHPFFGAKENTSVTVLDWDCLSPEWGTLDQHINRAIRDALNIEL